MLFRYVGITLVVLGGAMLLAPDRQEPDTPVAAAVREDDALQASSTEERPTSASLQTPDPDPSPAPASSGPGRPATDTPSALATSADPAQGPDETAATSIDARATVVGTAAGTPDSAAPQTAIVPTLSQPDTLGLALTDEASAPVAPADAAAPSIAPPGTPETADLVTLFVTGTRVNVRAGPSTDFGVVDSVSYGEAVELLEYSGDSWAEIRIDESTVGFMARRFLAETPGG